MAESYNKTYRQIAHLTILTTRQGGAGGTIGNTEKEIKIGAIFELSTSISGAKWAL
jgi:hypothetical protein